MKIAIWQQFSSNHSAGFTVVGTFETPEKAQQAANTIQKMVDTIYEWHRQNDTERIHGSMPPFPPELAFAQQYSVDWNKALDWTTEQMVVVDNFLILNPPSTWWHDSHPIPEIVQKLDGKAVYQDGIDVITALIIGHLTCLAPDVDTAKAMTEQFSMHLKKGNTRAPWDVKGEWDVEAWGRITHCEKTITMDFHAGYPEKTLPALLNYLKSLNCTNIEVGFRGIYGPIIFLACQIPDTPTAQFIEKEFTPLLKAEKGEAPWDKEGDQTWLGRGNIARKGQNIRMEFASSTEKVLLALVDYLKSLHCTNIEYTLKSADDLDHDTLLNL
jgi:hypothetical protein